MSGSLFLRHSIYILKRPHIPRYLWNDATFSEKLPILAAPLQFVASYAVNPRENSYKPCMLWNHSSLATFLSLTVKAHAHSVMHGQLQKPQHTYVKHAVRKAHLTDGMLDVCLLWLLELEVESGIQCHSRLSLLLPAEIQNSVSRNVQLMPTLFLKLTRYSNGTMANLAISTTPLWFDDASARNAFQCLEIIYIAIN